MVRRRDLEQMHVKIQVLEGKLVERDAEIAELRKILQMDTPKQKPAPAKQERVKKKGY